MSWQWVGTGDAQPFTVDCCNEPLALPPNTLAWRILDSDGVVQLAAADALWMEIEP